MNSKEGLSSQRIIQGSVWSLVSVIISNGSFSITLWVLSQLLPVEDYGLVGILISFTILVYNVSELGLGPALIQRSDLNDNHCATIFWTNMTMGVGLCGISVAIAPFVGSFFKASRIVTPFAVISISFVLHSLGAVQRSLLSKQLAFRQLAVPEIISAISLMIVSSVLATLGVGLFSIVGGVLARTSLHTVLLWKSSKWRPKFVWRYTAFKEMFGFGIWVVVASLISSFNSNVDYLIVGRFHGDTALSFYTLAYQLISYPRSALQPLVVRVAFPAFSTLQENEALLRKMYLKLVSLITLVLFPVMSFLIVTSPIFIQTIFGEKWNPSSMPLRILSIGGALFSIAGTWLPVYQAKGRADIGTKQNLITAVALSVLCLIGVQWGIVGVSAALTIYACIFVPLYQLWVNRLIGLSFAEVSENLIPATCGSLIAALFGTLIQFSLKNTGVSGLPLLILVFLCGGGSYIGYLLLFHRQRFLGLSKMFLNAAKVRMQHSES